MHKYLNMFVNRLVFIFCSCVYDSLNICIYMCTCVYICYIYTESQSFLDDAKVLVCVYVFSGDISRVLVNHAMFYSYDSSMFNFQHKLRYPSFRTRLPLHLLYKTIQTYYLYAGSHSLLQWYIYLIDLNDYWKRVASVTSGQFTFI